MFKNYLKIALRNMMKNKVYAFINIFGFAIGIASFILIGLHVADELSYDNFYSNYVEVKFYPYEKLTKNLSCIFFK